MTGKLKEAISKGNVCMIGPPGTGKSYLIIEMLAWLTEQKEISPQRILVFSFNRRWAKIIREEAAAAAAKSTLEMPINTFHSFCLDFLNEMKLYGPGDLKGIDEDITILNSTQQWNLLAEVMEELGKKDYPLTNRYLAGSSFTAKSYTQEVYDFILRAQENLLEPSLVSDRLSPYSNNALSEIAGIYSRYLKKLKEAGVYNYGLLLQDTAGLLEKERIRKKIQKNYDYIIVDEFQELNPAQLRIVELVSSGNCIFIGNDDESIYSFRGSVSENFFDIYNQTKKENIIRLKTNHRNSRNINRISQNFISKNKFRLKKRSSSSSSRGKVAVKDFYNMLEEAGFICSKIRELNAKAIRYSDMAIIIKGLGYETHMLENALQQNAIPFQRTGSRTVLDNNEVRYMLNILRLFRSPFEEIEDIDNLVEAVMLSSVLDIDPLYFKKLIKEYREASGYNNLIKFLSNKADKKEHPKAIRQFIHSIKKFSRLRQEDVFDFLSHLIKDKRIGLAAKKDIDWSGPSDFLSSVKNFSEANESSSIDAYLSFLDRVVENNFLEEIEKSSSDTGADKVSILSFHQCKGLEFEAVFIPFINMEYLPSAFNFPQSYDIQLFNYLGKGKNLNQEELKERHLEDERRLLYVGMTRAKGYLFITCNRVRQFSPFFLDLKKEAGKLPAGVTKKIYAPLDSSNCWQVRKRALVAAARKIEGLKFSRYKSKKFITFLNQHYSPGIWWNNIVPTTNKNCPFDVYSLPFSYSGLDAYRQCPLKYKYGHYIRAKTPPSLSLVLGNLYHQVLQDFFREGEFSWEKLRKILERWFQKQDLGPKAQKTELNKKALQDFKNFYNKLMPEDPSSAVNEKRFSFKLDSHTIKGRIDQINRLAKDEFEIIDYKSGSKKYYDRDLLDEIQLKTYRMAVDHSPDLSSLKDKKIRLKYISLGSSKPVAELPSGYYKEEELKTLIMGLIEGIQKEDFFAKEGYYSCLNCDFKILCERFYGQRY